MAFCGIIVSFLYGAATVLKHWRLYLRTYSLTLHNIFGWMHDFERMLGAQAYTHFHTQ